MSDALSTQAEPMPLARVDEGSQVRDLLQLASKEGKLDAESFKALVELQIRVSDRAADRELHDAMRAFQVECPDIAKSKLVSFRPRDGGKNVEYRFAPLDSIREAIQPLLDKHGLSYTWDTKWLDRVMEVTCTIRHRGGGKVSSSFTCPVEGSPTMSGPQKAASSVTFAKRQSLVAVLGLTMTDPDEDAVDRPTDPLTEDQAEHLRGLIDKVVKKDPTFNLPAFMRLMRAKEVAEIRLTDFGKAEWMLEAKLKGPKS